MSEKRKRGKSFYERQAALWLVRGRDGLENSRHKKIVADAIGRIGDDLVIPSQRKQLQKAILLNCDDGKLYCFRYLNIDFLSESDFYRRRERFLTDIFRAL